MSSIEGGSKAIQGTGSINVSIKSWLEDLITDCDPIARNCPENADCEPALFEKQRFSQFVQIP